MGAKLVKNCRHRNSIVAVVYCLLVVIIIWVACQLIYSHYHNPQDLNLAFIDHVDQSKLKLRDIEVHYRHSLVAANGMTGDGVIVGMIRNNQIRRNALASQIFQNCSRGCTDWRPYDDLKHSLPAHRTFSELKEGSVATWYGRDGNVDTLLPEWKLSQLIVQRAVDRDARCTIKNAPSLPRTTSDAEKHNDLHKYNSALVCLSGSDGAFVFVLFGASWRFPDR